MSEAAAAADSATDDVVMFCDEVDAVTAAAMALDCATIELVVPDVVAADAKVDGLAAAADADRNEVVLVVKATGCAEDAEALIVTLAESDAAAAAAAFGTPLPRVAPVVAASGVEAVPAEAVDKLAALDTDT